MVTAKKETIMDGPCLVPIYNRPPSANVVRVLTKELTAQEATRLTTKLDPKQLRITRQAEMQQALATESKQGRKLDALPDGMRFVVADSGKIMGISPANPKPVNEAVRNEFKMKRDEDKKKKKGKSKEDEEAAQADGQVKVFEETNKKYLESLFGKTKVEDVLQKNTRQCKRK